ncbi:MAG: hypothetical protein WC700_08940 [Gemmatimonadaceae bacterium]|jgi:hypothetical protein
MDSDLIDTMTADALATYRHACEDDETGEPTKAECDAFICAYVEVLEAADEPDEHDTDEWNRLKYRAYLAAHDAASAVPAATPEPDAPATEPEPDAFTALCADREPAPKPRHYWYERTGGGSMDLGVCMSDAEAETLAGACRAAGNGDEDWSDWRISSCAEPDAE